MVYAHKSEHYLCTGLYIEWYLSIQKHILALKYPKTLNSTIFQYHHELHEIFWTAQETMVYFYEIDPNFHTHINTLPCISGYFLQFCYVQ